jgi:ABC-type anion transport system duplicated permease subunit
VRISAAGVIYLVVGAIVAATHNYFENIDTLKQFLSAVLAVVLWPLILIGINLHVH